MFNNTRTMLGICGFLILSVTICGIFFFTEESQRSLRFWIVVGGIIFSEISFILSLVDIGGNHGDKGYFYRIINPFFAILYMICSLLILPISSLEISDKGLLFIEIVTLLIFVIATILNNMAATVTTAHAEKHYQASKNNKKWMAILSPYQQTLRTFDNDNLYKKFITLLDSIRYASVLFDVDTEIIDKKISDEIDFLITALDDKNFSVINEKLQNIEHLLQKRTAIIKKRDDV